MLFPELLAGSPDVGIPPLFRIINTSAPSCCGRRLSGWDRARLTHIESKVVYSISPCEGHATTVPDSIVSEATHSAGVA